MFGPETPSEQHVEAVVVELVEEVDHWTQQDPVVEETDDRDSAALLHAAVARPHLADSRVQHPVDLPRHRLGGGPCRVLFLRGRMGSYRVRWGPPMLPAGRILSRSAPEVGDTCS
jgi:hypothetical protein